METIKINERIKNLMNRRDRLIAEKRRGAYVKSPEHIFYMWSEGTRRGDAGESPGIDVSQKICIGDHLMRVTADYPFPGKEIPSSINGLKWDPVNWAEDYAYVLDNSPAEIFENEKIVGEFHWCLEEFRSVKYPKDIDKLGFQAREVGSGGEAFEHTCADLSIGLEQGWSGILKRIQQSLKNHEKLKNTDEVNYLKGCEIACNSIISFIKKHSEKAYELSKSENDEIRKNNLLKIAENCKNISTNPPKSFYEAIQWIWFFMIVERIIGHGNGYGRLDQLLEKFYKKDLAEGIINREEARELIAELFMKYSGNYFSLGGRDKNLKDATNDVSWIALEAYDMIGGTNTFGVMWHEDIDKDFFKYACNILAKYGSGSPALLNYDVMRQSELNYGFKPEDVWNISYSGCHWYCVPGKECCNHDMSVIILIICLNNAIDAAIKKEITNFNQLMELFYEEIDKAANALSILMDAQYKVQPKVWPEMITSLLTHGCIENGRDLTDRGVPYGITSINIFSLANTVDALFAIKTLVFEQKKFSLKKLKMMLDFNYEGFEAARQTILNLPKFGNDIDEIDGLARDIINKIKEILKNYKTIRGGFRASIYDFINHIYAPHFISATPDGRKKDEPLSHGPNPMHGRNKNGITATAKTLAKLGFDELAGGPLQLEIDPMLADKNDLGKILHDIVVSYFKMGGIHVFINIVSVETLKKALKKPENYGHIIVRLTGISVHFIHLDREIQEEIIKRTRQNQI